MISSDTRRWVARVCAMLLIAFAGCEQARGRLQITIVDETGTLTPARVTLLDSRGKAWIADDALATHPDCAEGWPPPTGPSAVLPTDGKAVWDPYTDTIQFYADGRVTADLPPGDYEITVRKGPEYEVQRAQVVIARHGTAQARLELKRWIDMTAEGWLSADDHLHISRTSASGDPPLATWMRAEDLGVANLLAMGTPDGIRAAPQAAYGRASVFTQGEAQLVSGQENPRSNNFGHVVILGAPTYIDFPTRYLVYNEFMRVAAREGGLSGYAHFGATGARNGLALDTPTGLVDFLEVLQTRKLETAVLYEMWNLGVRLTPTAGTDYPCGGIASLPGQERFYTQMSGAPSFDGWLEGLRAGRTFVTNGPMLTFDVDGQTMGDTIALDAPGTIDVRAEVRFDPAREDVEALELVQNGEVIERVSEQKEPGRIEMIVSPRIERSSWLALRTSGGQMRARVDGIAPDAIAHTATIEIVVSATPSVAEQAAGQQAAQAALERVNGLEPFIRKAKIPQSDREGLLAAIAAAQEVYRARVGND